MPEVAQGLDEEAAVEQVEDRVLDPTRVLVDGQPVRRGITRPGVRVGRRVEVAEEVPRRVDEGVHRVDVARRVLAAAARADDVVLERRVQVERRARDGEVEVVGKPDGELVARDGDLATGRAMHDRDRCTPRALARDQPVAQAVVDGRPPLALLLEVGGDAPLRLLPRESVVGAGVHRRAVARVRLGHRGGVEHRPVLGCDDEPDLDALLTREVEVALVVPGHGHDRAGAVVHEHVVGGVRREDAPVHRVDDVEREAHATLRSPRTGRGVRTVLVVSEPAEPFDVAAARHLLAERVVLGVTGHARDDERMLRGEHEVGRAVQRVGTRRIDDDLGAVVGRRERDLGTLAAADPRALRVLHALGPVDRVEPVEQLVRVAGDAEEPLRARDALDERPRTLAAPVDDLLVGEHRVVDRVPVDQRLTAVREARLEQLEEDPLRPVVVLGVAGAQHRVPVEGVPEADDRAPLLVDVRVRPRLRVGAALTCRVLRREPERVPADRVEDAVTGHAEVADERVVDREDLRVPHVQVARRVREHRERVERVVTAGVRRIGRRRAQRRRPLTLPALGELRLERGRVVPLGLHESSGCAGGARAMGTSRRLAVAPPDPSGDG